jgi:hypothetical protein
MVSFLIRLNFAEVHTNRIRIKGEKKMTPNKEKTSRCTTTTIYKCRNRSNKVEYRTLTTLSLVYTYLVVLFHKVQGVGTSDSIGQNAGKLKIKRKYLNLL